MYYSTQEMSLSTSIGTSGMISFPGADAASKAAAERLLTKDHLEHHCFFRPEGFHNHLSHHILTVYDLGAPASLIQAIYDEEAEMQRPVDLKVNGVVPEGVVNPGEINEDNWRKWLGDANAYAAYVAFFSDRIAALGVVEALNDYVFSPAANDNGSYMLFRLCAGLLHPFIQIGYGLEFGNEIQVAAGLAQAAVHEAQENMYNPWTEIFGTDPSNRASVNDIGNKAPATILALLQNIYDSPKLTPVLPYNPDDRDFQRLTDLFECDGGFRIAELKRVVSRFDPGQTREELDIRVEELVFTSTLLTFGTGKKNRKPRLDFSLMHLLTSTLFFPAFFRWVPEVKYKRALLITVLQVWGTTLIFRGRPRIDPALLTSFSDHPTPPNTSHSKVHPSSIDAKSAESINPWPAIVADALHAPDPHTIKVLRTLLYGAMKYGTVPKGGVVGTFGEHGEETHQGLTEVDGSIFVRAAGILMESLGWVTHGQEAGDWDRSGLGWEDAWKDED